MSDELTHSNEAPPSDEPLTPRRVAVVGATGFVGSHTVAALTSHGAHVVPLSGVRADPSRDRASQIRDIASLLADVDVVVNAAGLPHATSNEINALQSANGALPGLIAEACKSQHFIHVSSAAVQGDSAVLDDSPVNQLAGTPYAQSKILGELEAFRTGSHVTVYRPPGVHGPSRRVTTSLGRFARSRLASVAAPGTANSPQALIWNVADAIAFLALVDGSRPAVVHHPSEGLSTQQLLQMLGGKPVCLPPRFTRILTATLSRLGRINPAVGGHARRLDVLWHGQDQANSWLTARGWTPPLPSHNWETMWDHRERRHSVIDEP